MGRWSYLALFGSFSTLICCALPALFVSLGFGAVVATVASEVPALIWISENKVMVFALAGLMLLANGGWLWWSRNAPCPIDPELRQACISGRRFARRMYGASLLIFVVGGSVAFGF